MEKKFKQSNTMHLPSYRRTKINKTSCLTEDGMQVKIRKGDNKQKWEVFVEDVERNKRAVAYQEFQDAEAYNLISEINKFLMHVHDEVFETEEEAKIYFNKLTSAFNRL